MLFFTYQTELLG